MKEQLVKALKYVLEWTAIVAASTLIPSHKLTWKEVMMIAMVGAIAFAILDMYSPTVSDDAKERAGIILGFKTMMT